MNAKLLLGISALALAGAVSAQTVPAEQWVGAPIPAASHLSRAEVAADLSASRMSFASAPAEYRVGPADPATGATSRAEVAADTSLWIRSGMSQVANRDGFDPTSAEFRQQMAAYQRMRSGPEFMAEVQRAQSTRSMSMARFGRGSSAE
ncbi:hypothetical protein VAR608DRAFT_5337 [Variovorax sp. HW608]|uniref:hypothetical protein n=1 Tax=Variovorax sp. HW608 TaxID=1034889 RepID=UPI0008201CE3|nr:hypothetical protein [Variovorax sp. HW608]SCK52729.1 hypothetical protein VAR608DRAFT_5337 [Variovorax sp. HW608]